ncbi:transcriptional regulator, MarR family [Petrotoga mobilis SJ95]|jgi:DNA-binding MarR family transcriptional regulator|uniref:Transcriptional regulator, MarR family n=1 Tax=Petrotoga mobilis (strain DSM 10674 / SJ95) TaxID=403833 RepID=A9BHT3_PETMO|nr:MarR family transcriptional regulator [Petrotoga mobilis]ABX32048.1 transcriptional regulator, MarR family [Petrotoga mobilis SJ95]
MKDKTLCTEDFPFDELDPSTINVVQQFFQVMNLQRQLNFKIMAEKDVYPGQGVCLWHISKNPGISQIHLAKLMNVAPPTVSLILKRLEKMGLILRQSDPNDMRTLQIHLTEKGEEEIKNLKTSFSKIVRYSFEGLSDEELNTFNELLKKISNNLSKHLQKGEDQG